VNKLQLLTEKELFLTIDESSLLGKELFGILANSNEDEQSRDVLHPHGHGVTTEQSVAVSHFGNTKGSRIDVTAHQREEYLAVALPTMVKNNIEIKTAPDAIGKFKKAIEKGRNHTLGHLGKRLLHAFNFGGAGENACAVGVCLTHLTIEVIKMTLSGVGTKEVALGVIGTDCVPLLGTESLTPEQKGALESMEVAGFILLAGALKYAIPPEFDRARMSVTQVAPSKEDLTDIQYLGSGTFSNVFQVKKGEFMKMPKSAALEKRLVEEAAILRKLQSHESNSSLPRLVLDEGEGISKIQAVIRGEISEMVGLRLSGVVGVPLHRVPRDAWTEHSKSIITSVFEALEFAHNQSIYHMDVKPGNIIVSFDEGCRTMLSDWGSSVDSANQRTLKGFVGCPPYAHDRPLGSTFHTASSDRNWTFAPLRTQSTTLVAVHCDGSKNLRIICLSPQMHWRSDGPL
jgi:hypothetical protein